MIWIDVNRVGIILIPNYRIFVRSFFNFKIIFALRIFENNFASSRVFTLNFFWGVPRKSPVGDAQRSTEGVEDSAVAPLPGPGTLPGTVNLWVLASDDSRWIHSNIVICVTPEINTHFVTTLTTPKGEAPITVYLYINGSARLLLWMIVFFRKRSTYCNNFWPYSCRQERDMFHPSAVGVFWLICFWLLSTIFTKGGGWWWCSWYISKVRLVKAKRFWRSLFAHILLFSPLILVFTLINIIFVVRIYLTILIILTSPPWVITLELSTLMFAASSKSTVICFEYASYLTDSLATIIRCQISSNPNLYCAIISYILLTDTAFDVHVHSYIEWNFFTTFVHANITITWFFFLFRISQSLFLTLITIYTRNFFVFILFLVVRTSYVDNFQFLTVYRSNYRLICFVDVSNCFVCVFCSINIRFNSFGT